MAVWCVANKVSSEVKGSLANDVVRAITTTGYKMATFRKLDLFVSNCIISQVFLSPSSSPAAHCYSVANWLTSATESERRKPFMTAIQTDQQGVATTP
jgi:hypothetical protein